MTSTEKYKDLVLNLTAQGVNLTLDVWHRNSRENYDTDWNELAKKYGYRKPKNGYFSTGGHFYILLQRVYNKINGK